jgi:hypothetical protein
MQLIIHGGVAGFHYTKVEDKTQFTIHIRFIQMHTVHCMVSSSFILRARHYKHGLEEDN